MRCFSFNGQTQASGVNAIFICCETVMPVRTCRHTKLCMQVRQSILSMPLTRTRKLSVRDGLSGNRICARDFVQACAFLQTKHLDANVHYRGKSHDATTITSCPSNQPSNTSHFWRSYYRRKLTSDIDCILQTRLQKCYNSLSTPDICSRQRRLHKENIEIVHARPSIENLLNESDSNPTMRRRDTCMQSRSNSECASNILPT